MNNISKLNLNRIYDAIEYSRQKGWLETENIFNNNQRYNIKNNSIEFINGNYVNNQHLYPGDIIKINTNVCKIINYSINTKKHLVMILSHPLLRTTNIYLKLTNFEVIFTKKLHDNILLFNKQKLQNIPNLIKSINIVNKSNQAKINIQNISTNSKSQIIDYINSDYESDYEFEYRLDNELNREDKYLISIIKIQSIYRKYSIKKIYCKKLNSIILIQRFYRNNVKKYSYTGVETFLKLKYNQIQIKIIVIMNVL